MSRAGDAGKQLGRVLRERAGAAGRTGMNWARKLSVREVSRGARRWVSTCRTLGVRMLTAVRPWPG